MLIQDYELPAEFQEVMTSPNIISLQLILKKQMTSIQVYPRKDKHKMVKNWLAILAIQ